ncbi:hypothetical protein HMPREF9429_00450 [Megasphaera micronuciformis F0359]|uniref:Uncharacterized protein n=1 Tax=Megasphaera micronuciformis F0359 TaxID=706434 RepID=E2ZAI7_9FIRM|nr:hypothetical protein HMPREF9429_00450 [Megasphaera micronuciformis F0359]
MKLPPLLSVYVYYEEYAGYVNRQFYVKSASIWRARPIYG